MKSIFLIEKESNSELPIKEGLKKKNRDKLFIKQ
jgi:hypothetical protein